MPLRPTLRDIAKESGYSISTVSAALNNDPRVRESTRKIIHEIAEKVGYTPDPALMALSTYRWQGKRNLAGMTIAYLSDRERGHPDFLKHKVLLESMKRQAESLGYRLYVYHLPEMGSVKSIQRILLSRSTSGIIVGPICDKSLIEGFDWSLFSAIAADLGHYRLPLPLLTNDPLACVRVAWRKVLEAGYKRIGVILAPDTLSEYFNEQRAWVTRLQNELPPRGKRIPLHNYNTMEEMDEWYENHTPDVVIGYHEWLVEALDEIGLRVPEDVAFVSLSKLFREYPDIPQHPEISGMVIHPDRLGAMAVDQVDLLIRRNKKGLPPVNFSIYLDLSWHRGNTLPEKKKKKHTIQENSGLEDKIQSGKLDDEPARRYVK